MVKGGIADLAGIVAGRERDSAETWERVLCLVLAGLLVLLLGLRLVLVFTANVNWDEFLFLSKVHAYLRGDLVNPLQTFQVHLFAWLPSVEGTEVDQVIAARLVVFVLSLGSLAFLERIGSRFLSPAGVLLALVAWQAFPYVVDHGSAFRADTLCSFLFLAALWFLLAPPAVLARLAPGAAGLCLALGLAISIKVALYLPVAGLVLLLREGSAGRDLLNPRRWPWVDLLVFAGALSGGLALLIGLHSLGLPAASAAEAGRMAGASAEKMFFSEGFFPRWPWFAKSLVMDPVFWFLLAGGAAVAAREALAVPGQSRSAEGWREARRRGLLLLAFLLPVLTPLVYRNAFPYYYVFILAPAVLLIGLAADRLLGARPEGHFRPRHRLTPLLLLVAALVMAAPPLLRVAQEGPGTGAQRALLTLVHRIFPEPVPYIDRASLVSSFPKVGFFMSSWGMDSYRQAGRPVFDDLIRAERPLFVIADNAGLELHRRWQEGVAGHPYALLREDFEALRGAYIRHWGPLYVAGQELHLPAGRSLVETELPIQGSYRLEAPAPVLIDGEPLAPGESIYLLAGRLRLQASQPEGQTIRLRWAAAGSPPDRAPPDEPLYRPF